MDKYAALKADIYAAQRSVKTAQTALFEAMAADHPIQPGDIVRTAKGKTAIVRELVMDYGGILPRGSNRLKSGEFSEHLVNLYKYEEWSKV